MENKERELSTCPECRKRFVLNRKGKVFCSARCKFANWSKKHPRVGVTNKKGECHVD
jgi:endogenous inhibitor of DNA gyrase (YacG/DUF329 family)